MLSEAVSEALVSSLTFQLRKLELNNCPLFKQPVKDQLPNKNRISSEFYLSLERLPLLLVTRRCSVHHCREGQLIQRGCCSHREVNSVEVSHMEVSRVLRAGVLHVDVSSMMYHV